MGREKKPLSNPLIFQIDFDKLAEGMGFEPTVGLYKPTTV